MNPMKFLSPLKLIAAFIGTLVMVGLILYIPTRKVADEAKERQDILIMKRPDLPELKTNKRVEKHINPCQDGVIAYLRADGTLVGCIEQQF
jgi:hypothetical protein